VSQLRIFPKTLSELTLPDFCPRCFWLKLHIRQLPFQIFPGDLQLDRCVAPPECGLHHVHCAQCRMCSASHCKKIAIMLFFYHEMARLPGAIRQLRGD